jgi:hypothetical protein
LFQDKTKPQLRRSLKSQQIIGEDSGKSCLNSVKQLQQGIVNALNSTIMKYTTEVTIHLNREKVIELFDSTENLYQWQPGLKSIEPLKGEPGQEGSQSRLVYEGRKGDLVMTETITKRNLPGEFHGTYKARGVYNEVYNYFTEPEPGTTLWRSENIFRFSGAMAVMIPFMKKAFKNNTLLSMERFKVFAEAADKK